MKKKLIIFILLQLFVSILFSLTLVGQRVADIISIGAFRYYLKNKIMPDSLESIKQETYIKNADYKFAMFDEYGYIYDIEKISDKKVVIRVTEGKTDTTIIYEENGNHHFLMYLNKKLVSSYYRDEYGKLIY
ncbi:MAG: hypothetical protein K6E22_00395 [Treponema sp.]|nr:hypothetical protein [Treponema sp.]